MKNRKSSIKVESTKPFFCLLTKKTVYVRYNELRISLNLKFQTHFLGSRWLMIKTKNNTVMMIQRP